MSQLLIIDVQNTYKNHIPKELIRNLPEYAKNFGEILYLWDDISGQDYYEEIPEEWMEDEDFYVQLKSFTKNYAFLRGFMDKDVADDDIVELGKFMLKHNITDGREIAESDEEIVKEYNNKFKNSSFFSLSFDDYTFQDRVSDGVTIVGGGENECLKEVCLLLQMLGITYKTDSSFIY